jgi:hypothetical protein
VLKGQWANTVKLYIIYNYLLYIIYVYIYNIISVVYISANSIDTGIFPLGSKCTEAKKFSE